MGSRVVSLCLLLACFALPAFSATINVPSDQPTIQAGVDLAMVGDTVLVAPGTYTGLGNRDIELTGVDIVILGADGPTTTIIDCEEDSRAFYIHLGESTATRIEGFTIRKGYETDDGGAIYLKNGSATLSNLVIQECRASLGGAVYLRDSSSRMENIWITECMARTYGGAIFLYEAILEVQGATLIYNWATDDGGGIASFESLLSMTSCSIVSNRCGSSQGSGIWLHNGELGLNACLVSYNGSFGYGVSSPDHATIFTAECCNFFGNYPANVGGLLTDPTGANGNISQDPLFCDIGNGDFNLHSLSPCLPSGNDCGVTIGVQTQGCDGDLYQVSGRVIDDGGIGLSAIELTGLDIPLTTDEQGNITFLLPAGWSGTLTPTTSGHIFVPESVDVVDLQADHQVEDIVSIHPTHVSVPGDFETIYEAMDFATDGDTVTVGPGEYNANYGAIGFMGEDILLRSLEGPEATILTGGYPAVTFDHQEGPGAVLNGFTFSENELGAIKCLNNSSPTLTNLIFEDNSSWPCLGCCGAGLYCDGYSSPIVMDVIFRNNSAADGGALYCTGGAAPMLINIVFENNYGNLGGAVYVKDASPQFSYCSFVGNSVSSEHWESGGSRDGHGGAVYCFNASPTFDYCLFDNNRTDYHWWSPGDTFGGAFCIIGNSNPGVTAPSITNCTFFRNSVTDQTGTHLGGAFYFAGSSEAVLARNIIAFSIRGGGIHVNGTQCVPFLYCNDIYGNADGNYLGDIGDQTGTNYNISINPLLCDPDNDLFTLAADSRCLPENNDCGLLIGAFDVGCEETPVILASFTATSGDAGVKILWRLNGVDPETELRLTAEHDGISRQLDWVEESPGLFLAYDTDAIKVGESTVMYRLQTRQSGEVWLLLGTVEFDLPAAAIFTELMAPFPNPFNPTTEITFSLSAAATVSLQIYDLSGRLVRGLVTGEDYEAGVHQLTWNGADNGGKPLVSGVYLCRLISGDFTESKKITLLK